MTDLNPILRGVTDRIRERSLPERSAYLELIAAARREGPRRHALSCANLAHVFAASGGDKSALSAPSWPNIGIVTAYNDMLSAHQPLARYPDILKAALREAGATGQVAGGVPAMCDGVTQGRAGMELSLLSRDVIALSAAIALSHDAFDGALMLGVCDKIVPGLVIAALHFGHLPSLLVPAGPMPSGLPNKEKSKIRQAFAEGRASRAELLEAEAASYHAPGTCTFYGTANSNQMLMEAMGLHVPGTAFVAPGTPLRDALTRMAAAHVASLTALGRRYRATGEIIDERSFVNAIAILNATGGSTNHLLHLIAMARAAGIILTLDDFDAISRIVPLLARIYPNGEADVNHFQSAGGTGFIIRELMDSGLYRKDARTMWSDEGPIAFTHEPWLNGGQLSWRPAPAATGDRSILRPVSDPFEADGGIRILKGDFGLAAAKVSAVAPQYRRIEAPALVFDDQAGVAEAFNKGLLGRDAIIVLRGQGPRANGMPELHGLTPILGLLQDRGHKVALLTDGRMSGASGKILAAIHVTPEAASGGPIAQIRDGDLIRIDSETREITMRAAPDWRSRRPAEIRRAGLGLGRELFQGLRGSLGGAEEGAGLFAGYT